LVEQNQSKRAFDVSLIGGYYFHPIEQSSLVGDPGNHSSDEDLSLGTPERKKPLEGSASGQSDSDFAIAARRHLLRSF
jgi:hypothetical protein